MDHQSSRTYSIFSRLISDEITIMAIRGIIVGLAGGFGAIGFRYLIGFFQSISYGSAGELLDMVSKIPWCFRIGIPALGGAGGRTHRLFPGQRSQRTRRAGDHGSCCHEIRNHKKTDRFHRGSGFCRRAASLGKNKTGDRRGNSWAVTGHDRRREGNRAFLSTA